MLIKKIISIFKKYIRQIDLTDNYKMIIEQIEDDFKKILKEIGLGEIADKIKPKYIVKNNPKIPGKSYLILKIICIDKGRLDKYIKSPNYKIELYHTLFHELIHLSRELKNDYYLKKFIISIISGLLTFVLLMKLSLYSLPISIPLAIISVYELFIINHNPIEEIATEIINQFFLSKKFGKERIKEFLRKIIISTWKTDNPKHSDGKHVYYLYFKDKKHLPYDLGRILGYILLNIEENKQREYAKRLLTIYKRKDLMSLLNDLRKDLPNDEESIKYYDLLKDIIGRKAKILYKD